MNVLTTDICKLRAVDPEDLDFIYALENNPDLWDVGHTLTPYSKYTIREYLENAHRDIYEVKQLRLAICRQDDSIIGVVDLYDFDPYHKRAGVGIVISSTIDRSKGYATAAMQLMINYAFRHLRLHQLYAGVSEDNLASRKLFEKLRFRESGIKKDWIATETGFKDEIHYQLINE
ncbi:GNAT family N-acetyltransferase [Nonlabens ponticola]|uniref:N-acetyltransferase n=1 Tax=Nonlabens ponticola TaxID=2496866 RepID=A0A3S9MYA1_9FLAO|nr:GNAT family N-acetyltransferase [Nonlabens ponticola]AZQ44128.1 N-acetyltransferase [Nonlabens ponticola]